jgi:hypothetical protein
MHQMPRHKTLAHLGACAVLRYSSVLNYTMLSLFLLARHRLCIICLHGGGTTILALVEPSDSIRLSRVTE